MPKYKNREINPEFIIFWTVFTGFLTIGFSMTNGMFLLLCPLISLIAVYFQLEKDLPKNESIE